MALTDELNEAKKLSPEDRIKKLEEIKKKLAEETKKQEKEIDDLKNETKSEIQKEDLEEMFKPQKQNKLEQEIYEEKGKPPIQYGEKIQEIKDNIYNLTKTDDWGPAETQLFYETEKKIEKIEKYEASMSKYAADQVDQSRKALKHLMYRK